MALEEEGSNPEYSIPEHSMVDRGHTEAYKLAHMKAYRPTCTLELYHNPICINMYKS